MLQQQWFERKTYGFGWKPITWQGWAVSILILFNIFTSGLEVALNPINLVAFVSILQIVFSIALLFFICLATGPTPKWQWGNPEQPSKEYVALFSSKKK